MAVPLSRLRPLLPPPLPREHGSWAALLIPLLAAGAVLGTSLAALRLAGAAAALFMARAAWGQQHYPQRRAWARLWLAAWVLLAGALAWPLLIGDRGLHLLAIGAAGVAAEGLVSLLGRRSPWRSLLGDLLGTVASALLVPAYALALSGEVGPAARALTLMTVLFWAGSVMRVRSQIRERANRRFHQLSLAVHLACLGVAAGWAAPYGWALVPSVLHAAWIAARPPGPEPTLRVGLREIGHGVGFVMLVALLGLSGRGGP